MPPPPRHFDSYNLPAWDHVGMLVMEQMDENRKGIERLNVDVKAVGNKVDEMRTAVTIQGVRLGLPGKIFVGACLALPVIFSAIALIIQWKSAAGK